MQVPNGSTAAMFAGALDSAPEAYDNCLRDVVALSTLPAIWTGADPLRIAENLAASIFTMLEPEFVYVSFEMGSASSPVAIAQTGRYEADQTLAEQIRPTIVDWARAHDPDDLLPLKIPGRSGTVRVATRAIGLNAELGALAAAFAPEYRLRKTDLLLLNVAATQAAVAVQNAKLLQSLQASELRANRAAEELSRRLGELEAANVEIRESRRAALNLMEEAVQARETAEELNRELRTEIGHRKIAENALRQSEERLAADLNALRRIQQVRTRLVGSNDLHARLSEILAAAADLTGTDKGNIQLYDPESRVLRIVVHQGVGPRFLERFMKQGSPAVCDVAAQRIERMVWEDIGAEPALQGTEDLAVILGDGIRAIQSTPIVALDGRLLGLLNNHYRTTYNPGERELGYLDLLARMAADFIERWQSEEALEQAEKQLRSLVERAPFGIYIVDSQFRIAVINAGSQTGAFRNVNPAVGRDFADAMRILWPEPVAAEVIRVFRNTLETGEPYRSRDFVHQRHDIGVEEAYEWELHRIVLPDGQYGVVCYYYDSTQLRQTEQALRRSESALRNKSELLSAALSASDTGTFRWNPHSGEFLEFDDNLKRLFGKPPETDFKVTEDFIKLVHSDDVPGLISAVDACRRDGADFSMEYRVIHPGGSIRWLYDRAKMERDLNGRPTYLIGACTDITKRKEAEIALRDSIERFHFVAESMPQKIFTATPAGDIDYFNQQWLEFTGVPFDEIKGWGWTRIIHPEDLEEHVRLWRHAIQTGEPFQCVHRLQRGDGVYRWHLSRARAMRDRAGRISMWIGSNTDIDEQKKIEVELRRLNDDLSQFAFAASHDLQEPLRMMTSYSQLLLKGYQGNLDSEAAMCVDFITRGAQRMRDLLNDLLSYTRVTAEEREPSEFVDLNAVVDNVRVDLTTLIESSGAVVDCDRLPALCVHDAHVRQLFQNLISNAVKYRGAAPPRIQIRARKQGPDWRFAVSDNGMGIEPEYQQTIFGVFKRLHGKTIPGTGIGLAICQRVVERYGGRIWVESSLNRGSTFYFTLPLAKERMNERQSAGTSDPHIAGRRQ